MRVGSFRWWFQNRETGAITVAQAPNLSLTVAVSGWVVGALVGGALGTAGRLVAVIGFVWWAGDEVIRGVNPWRRVLGGAVLGWQVARLVG